MNVLGMWMWPESVRIRGAEKVIEVCARAKVTDIYFLTKGLGGTTAYPGKFAPFDEERDLLRELLDAAHANGIRIHAWFTSGNDEHYKQIHPESGRYHFKNGRDKGLISLADEGYLAYMKDITVELCSNYDIDGLHLDYIRYNHLVYGWSDEDLSRYAAEGTDTERLRSMMQRMFYAETKEETLLFDAYNEGDESALALARARRKDVVRFAETLCSAARSVKKDIILSAALMPEGAYDNIAFSDLHYGQNYEDASKLYDYALPMAYSKAYDKDSLWVRMAAEGTLRRGMKTIVGLHAYDGGTGPSLQKDIAVLDGTGVEGVCLFREGATAMAFASGNSLALYNALKVNIDRATALNGEDAYSITETILPGEEKTFPLPFRCESLRIFSGDEELCVYLTNED